MGLPMCRHGVARGSGSSQMNTFGETLGRYVVRHRNGWNGRENCGELRRARRPRTRARRGGGGPGRGGPRSPGALGALARRRGREVQVDRQHRGVVVRLRRRAAPRHPHPPTGLRAAEAVGACSGARAAPPRPTRAGPEQLCAAGRGGRGSSGTREAGATGGCGACWRVFSSAIRGSPGWSAVPLRREARSVAP